jgi:GT2 family glycosyltransferase
LRGLPEVAIAIVSWNTRELLRACLRSMEPDVEAGLAEVWVVDNASSDGSPEMAQAEFPWANVIASSENLGFGPAVNLVARRATTPWLAISNADVELRERALTRLLEAGTRHPRAGVVAPRLVLPTGATQHSAYRFPTLGFTLVFNLGLPVLSRRLAAWMLLEGYWQGDRPRRIDWALGAFLLARREAFDAIGGFDEQQWMYAEDVDLGWRIAAAGWETRFEPAAVVLHHGAAATTQVWGDARDVRWQRSTYAWMLRRRGLAVTRAYGLLNTLGAAARAVLYGVLGRVRGEPWPGRAAQLRHWTRLHLGNLLASTSSLREHR